MLCVVHSLDSMAEEQPLLRIMASTSLAEEAFQNLVEQLEDARGRCGRADVILKAAAAQSAARVHSRRGMSPSRSTLAESRLEVQ